jgi:hypothetical protein
VVKLFHIKCIIHLHFLLHQLVEFGGPNELLGHDYLAQLFLGLLGLSFENVLLHIFLSHRLFGLYNELLFGGSIALDD